MLWIAGALADGPTRTLLWLIALAIDYAGPLCTFYVPGMRKIAPRPGRSRPAHFAERFQLFVILALGESIVVTGATAAGRGARRRPPGRVLGRVPGHRGDVVAVLRLRRRDRPRRLALAENSTQMARDAYTYLHVVMVAGVIVAAVGDELVIAHPAEVLHGAELIAVCAGPAIYLLAQRCSGCAWRGR